jgi:hypothetical protein
MRAQLPCAIGGVSPSSSMRGWATLLSCITPPRRLCLCGGKVPRGAAAVAAELLEAALDVSGALAPDAAKMVSLGSGGLCQRAAMARGQRAAMPELVDWMAA